MRRQRGGRIIGRRLIKKSEGVHTETDRTRCQGAKVPRCKVPRCHGAKVPRSWFWVRGSEPGTSTLAPWHRGTLEPALWHPWHSGTVAPWHPGTLALCHSPGLRPGRSTSSMRTPAGPSTYEKLMDGPFGSRSGRGSLVTVTPLARRPLIVSASGPSERQPM